jgi:hypothetical protein
VIKVVGLIDSLCGLGIRVMSAVVLRPLNPRPGHRLALVCAEAPVVDLA